MGKQYENGAVYKRTPKTPQNNYIATTKPLNTRQPPPKPNLTATANTQLQGKQTESPQARPRTPKNWNSKRAAAATRAIQITEAKVMEMQSSENHLKCMYIALTNLCKS
jgi:hypothetical protein